MSDDPLYLQALRELDQSFPAALALPTAVSWPTQGVSDTVACLSCHLLTAHWFAPLLAWKCERCGELITWESTQQW